MGVEGLITISSLISDVSQHKEIVHTVHILGFPSIITFSDSLWLCHVGWKYKWKIGRE